MTAEPPRAIVRINVYLSAFEGDDWDDADTAYAEYVTARLRQMYPSATLDVSTRLGETRVWAYHQTPYGNQLDDDVTTDLTYAIKTDWWADFCSEGEP